MWGAGLRGGGTGGEGGVGGGVFVVRRDDTERFCVLHVASSPSAMHLGLVPRPDLNLYKPQRPQALCIPVTAGRQNASEKLPRRARESWDKTYFARFFDQPETKTKKNW